MTQLECNEFEILLCDYVDNTLHAEGRVRVEAHASACPNCAAMMADVCGATAFLERVSPVEMPNHLVTKILFDTPAMEKRSGVTGWIRGLLQPILQPKFAMGMAMTILSFSMLGRITGINTQLKPSDLDPVKVYHAFDDSLHRGWERAVKYYDNLRVVYEIQTRLREWNDQDEEERRVQQLKTDQAGGTPAATESGLIPSESKK